MATINLTDVERADILTTLAEVCAKDDNEYMFPGWDRGVISVISMKVSVLLNDPHFIEYLWDHTPEDLISTI